MSRVARMQSPTRQRIRHEPTDVRALKTTDNDSMQAHCSLYYDTNSGEWYGYVFSVLKFLFYVICVVKKLSCIEEYVTVSVKKPARSS